MTKDPLLSQSRRDILLGASAGVMALSAPARLRAATPKHVLVAGGGFAGSTAAKYLRVWGDPSLQVTLVDPEKSHTSCVMSNLVLNRSLRLRDLRFPLSGLESYGVTVLRAKVDKVDPAAMSVKLDSGETVGYDKLVLTGGVSFIGPDGWSARTAPHAWKAGAQTTLLRNRIEAMPAGGTFIMTIPKSPYRCPPGPYERACTVAEVLHSNPGARVVVLDANAGIQATKVSFTRAFNELYSGIIDYRPNVEVESVEAGAGLVHTNAGTFRGDVINIIPTHRASALVRRAGAVPKGSKWAPVDPLSYASTLAGYENIHVIGDSQGTGQPKSGHMANAQAKVCADAILRILAGESIDTLARVRAVTTNSACFSPITADEASWLTAVFAYDETTGEMRVVPGSLAESGGWSRENYREMFDWSNNLWTDTFK
ncbi:MAG: NAD(P)/FAD-dependent oxidoreductase [Rhodobacter sp.]|nr:NAD(P)/FAD-dependent oxidoreductase [Rhodobacter sp.]